MRRCAHGSETPVSILPEVLALLEATAITNNCNPEEIIRAVTEVFLESDRESQVGE